MILEVPVKVSPPLIRNPAGFFWTRKAPKRTRSCNEKLRKAPSRGGEAPLLPPRHNNLMQIVTS